MERDSAIDLVEFKREALERLGFNGFVEFQRLQHIRPPDTEGVYVIVRDKEEPPAFLQKSTGGRFKNQDPTVDLVLLEQKWVQEARVVYIGKARSLRRRLDEYRRFGAGVPIGHWGGRYIWQCADVSSFLVAWLPTENPRQVEKDLIARFIELYGRRPFANVSR